MNERTQRELHAYHDGELSALGRWRVRRRLERDPQARELLARWSEIGALLREREAQAVTPHLWNAIRAELPRTLGEPVRETRLPWIRWAAPALAAAAAAAALTLTLFRGDAPDAHSVRWLDAGGRPAMVLQDDREATIIWVLEGPVRAGEGASGAVL